MPFYKIDCNIDGCPIVDESGKIYDKKEIVEQLSLERIDYAEYKKRGKKLKQIQGIKEFEDSAKQESGKFAKKIFIQILSNSDLVAAINYLEEQGHRSKIKTEGFEIPKKGIIVFISQTLMQWGKIKLQPNTEIKRNKLRALGYFETNFKLKHT